VGHPIAAGVDIDIGDGDERPDITVRGLPNIWGINQVRSRSITEPQTASTRRKRATSAPSSGLNH